MSTENKSAVRIATIGRTYEWRAHSLSHFDAEALGPDWYYLIITTELGTYRADMQLALGAWVVWVETPLDPVGVRVGESFFVWSPERAMEAAEKAITEAIAQIEPS